MPSSRRPEISDGPNESAPTRPTIRTEAPSRAAATAWLPPLPPWMVSSRSPSTVSPGLGSSRTRTTRSMLMLPSTATVPTPPILSLAA